ncbi:hypothetical protein AHF37_09495 [Paragonimus kellicotti]|nr:hypothetical protein AHF37_09495 [Paragonimus kellicotti]
MTVFRANSIGPKDYLEIYKPYGNLLNNKAELELRNFLKDRHTLLAVKKLQAYMRDVSNTLVFRLKDEVADAAERLNFLLDYAFLSADDIKLNSTLFYWPEHILNVLDVTSTRVNMLRETAEEDLKQRTTSLEQRILNCWDRITLMRKREVISQEEMVKSVQILDEFLADLDVLTLESEQVNKEEALVQWELTQFPQLVELRRQMEPFDRLWRTSLEFDVCNRSWLQAPYHTLNPFDLEQQISDMYKTMHKLTKTLADLPGPAKVAQKMKPQPDTQLITFLEYGLKNYLDQLEEVGAAAAKEHQLETTMAKMKEEWRLMRFELLPYRDTGISILSAIDDIQVLLDDHIIKAQTMRNSPYIKPFEKEMIAWETKLVSMNDILDVWLKVQATWLYLEPIFSSEDILAQMPEEGRKFGVVDVLWREVMTEAAVNPSCLVATDQRDMLRRLTDAHILLEEIQKGLNDYLEKKRLYFPR